MNSAGLLPGLLVFTALGIAGCFVLRFTRLHRKDLAFQYKLFFIAYIVRFILSIVVYQTDLVNVLGDEDSSGWYNGVVLEQRWEAEKIGVTDLPRVWTEAYDGEHRGYFYLLGMLFTITGTPERLVAAALNCFFGALTVVFTLRIG